jgi:hypothetical protein
MSMEQNEPQVSQGQQGPPPSGASESAESTPATSPNGQQQRRRRRRRKIGRAAAPAPEAPPSAQSLPGESTGEPVRQQPAERAPHRAQEREPRQAAAQEGSAQNTNRGRQGREQQPHGKKQQRQAKGGGSGGGSSQGRQFQRGPQPARENNPGNGSGAPPAGARRKNKARRPAPSFVGPMDHSYRAVNGNIADGSPSTMDYRSNAIHVNGNGNVHGRNGYSDAEIATPVLLREDAPVRIICFIEDLFVVAKMQETARKLGVKVSFAKAEKDTVTKLLETPEGERPSLIVFDLNNVNAKPLTLIPKLKAKLKRATSVIGFLSHIQGDLKVKAIEAGCDMVMPKSAFSQNLPNLLRRHGLDEEMEPVEA